MSSYHIKSLRVFTVEGSGLFPFDMLRYDACHPASERDSAQIEATTHGVSTSVRQVKLVATSLGAPTEGRWQSFGWRVVGDVKVERL